MLYETERLLQWDIIHLKHQLADERSGECDKQLFKENRKLQKDQKVLTKIAHTLWYLLNDISNYGFRYKPEQTDYFKAVSKRCEEKDKYFQSDGYILFPSPTLEALDD